MINTSIQVSCTYSIDGCGLYRPTLCHDINEFTVRFSLDA